MDPFAALGAAATIAQFVGQSISLVNGARQIHKLALGSTTENKRLGTVIQELKTISKRLVSKRAPNEQSDAERSLSDLALECQILSEKILRLLEKMKAKNPSSLRQSAVAALRSAWSESEKKELVEQVERCRNMMHTQLSAIFRSSTVSRLDNIIENGKCNAEELSSLQKNVHALRSGVTLTEIGPDVEQQLCKLLSISDKAMNRVTQYRILNSLAFEKMHQRFDSVGKAHHESFEWILDGESESQESEDVPPKTDKKILEKRNLFRRWLQSGTEIFHIAGKLGSGKSTLMKFLYTDRRSTDLLKTWARDRQLVIAKFFFWKPGMEMENSVNGMVRTLLYDVLRQCPDLTPLIFPDQWNEVQESPWQATRNSGKPRCFCFFIDGLDEFNGAGKQDDTDLVNTLRSWTQSTTEDPHRCQDIKLCVSSREQNAFIDNFSSLHRLRLQDLNRIDLVAFLGERLTSHKSFQTLEFTKNTSQEQFIDQIVDQAAGVFLWASLVLITLRQGLDNGDRLLELQRKLDCTPSDIEELFGSLIAKIHKGYRQQAARTFLIMSTLWKCKYDRMTLFAYSFLDEFEIDHNFAIKMPVGPRIGKNEIVQQLNRARKQLYGRCQGLVEIRKSMAWKHHSLLNTALEHDITVVHRSIYEFLQIPEHNKWMEQYLENFSPVEAICQSTIAIIKRLSPLSLVAGKNAIKEIEVSKLRLSILQALHCLRYGAGRDLGIQCKIITCLSQLLPRPQYGDALLLPRLHKLVLPEISIEVVSVLYLQAPGGLYYLDINYLAAEAGLFDYLTWALDPGRNHTYGPSYIATLIYTIVVFYPGSELALTQLAFIESIFKQHISPNMTATRSSAVKIIGNEPKEAFLSVWGFFLSRGFQRILRFDPSFLQVVEILLKFGADPRISISPVKPDGFKTWVKDPSPAELTINFTPSSQQRISGVWNSEVVQLLASACTGGTSTPLRDIFEYQVKATDSELGRRCLALMDRNLELIKKSPTALEDPASFSSTVDKPLSILSEHKSHVGPLKEDKMTQKEQSAVDQGAKSINPVDQ